MMVGPEFAPVAAICYGIVRSKPKVAGMAATTLLGGFALSALIAWAVWAILYALGVISFVQANTGPLTGNGHPLRATVARPPDRSTNRATSYASRTPRAP